MELALFMGLVLSFIWLWARAFEQASLVVYVAGLGLVFAAHWRHGERPADLGLRLDNLAPALKDAAVPALPLIALFGVIGWLQGHWSAEALGGERFARLLLWGFLQQYLLQGFIHRRLMELLPTPARRELATAALFALLHLPNPILVPVTFLAGYVFAVLFRRNPNLFVLALCHAAGSTAVAYAFDPEVLYKMRVGPGYFRG
ncbi:MAG TPA: CPBP family glutamic-type intramembrane protease [Candidatus Polarisedimenticolia bacterium]|nr:CPBP family glutamic-type intramembrane protease [Candidatus Polarisedimenticolia bacterium]